MNGITVTKHGHSRFWAVKDGAGELICVCVYKRGALEVARRLAEPLIFSDDCLRETALEESARSGQMVFS